MQNNWDWSGVRAAIFDMDGTLVDSMSEWRRLNAKFVRSRGVEPTPEEERELFFLSGFKAVDYVKEHYDIDTSFEELCELSAAEMERIYGEGLPLKPGARALLDRLHARGILCVLATATPARQALVALNRTRLVGRLDYIFSTEMLGGYKGEVSFFEKLCASIGVPPEACVMVEDGLYAMRTAREAGLRVIGITDATNACDREVIAEACDALVDSYDELP